MSVSVAVCGNAVGLAVNVAETVALRVAEGEALTLADGVTVSVTLRLGVAEDD